MPRNTKDTINKSDEKIKLDSKIKKTTTSAKTKTTKTTKGKTTAAKQKTSVKNTEKKSAVTKNTKTKSKKVLENIKAEYYDLPYRYNETIVKILYQTPNILFVYWDISDNDRENFINTFGEHFFYNTKPYLKIYNLSKNYNFEVEINDFANCWYIDVNDAYCEYKVELIRKTVKYEEKINNDTFYISTSNNIEFPNDHILIDELSNIIKFKNVKTNSTFLKDISTMRLIGINKIYNVNKFYRNLYKDDLINKKVINASSSSSSWS